MIIQRINTLLLGILAFCCAHTSLLAQKDASLALTPPMGWNSWNVFAGKIDEQQLMGIADIMVSSGMRDAGYVYLNIDDNWMAGRDPATKRLLPDPVRFPRGIKHLADYVHARGLKLGIYGDRGTMTCLDIPESGSLGFEELDARTFAEWGVDYLKYDNCNAERATVVRDYERMARALLHCGRPIVFSVCEWGENNPTAWAPGISHLWRTGPDITDTWPRILKLANLNNSVSRFQAPGGWNDPDMLEVGNGGCTHAEYQTHFALWCIMASPLIVGCDLRSMTAETRSILLNRELIAVNQDPAGIQGERVRTDNGQLWVKPLKRLQGPEKAVLLFNNLDTSADIRFELPEVGLRYGPTKVRDLWRHQDLPDIDRSFTAQAVPPHGCVVLKLMGSPGAYTSVPSVGGLPLPQALALLDQYGLRAGNVRQIQTDRWPSNHVVRQNIECGRKVFEGATVNLDVTAPLAPEPGKFFVEEWSRPETTIAHFPEDQVPNRTWYADALTIPEYHGDVYSLRLTGVITPPVTGDYRFTIAANDEGQLWLSTDATAANKTLICSDRGTLSPKDPLKKESQTSKPIRLEKGKGYYLEARLSENWSEDFIQVGWIRPDGASEKVIGSEHLLRPFQTRNPVYQRDGWSVKDGTMAWRDGTFHLFFNAYYPEDGRECCHLVAVTTRDFHHYSEPLFVRSGAERGWLGIAAPNLTQVGETWYLTYNSWGDKPGQPNQLFYATSTNLTDWTWDLPLATNATRNADGPVRAIDAAIAHHGGKFYLVWKESNPDQVPQMAVADRMGADGWRRLGRPGNIWFENGQFLRLDGRWHLLVTGPGHLPHLAAMRGSGDRESDWLDWEPFRALDIPLQSFNTNHRANSAFLADWRALDGFYYLLYAGRTEGQTHAGRGNNALGLARSPDLITWEAATEK